MNVVDWAHQLSGQVVTAPGGVGGQCVDLANIYLLAQGLPAVRKNAAAWSEASTLAGIRRWMPNRPLNYPTKGAIVVWHANVLPLGIGPYGHIAVALAADPMQLLTLDQDWPIGAPVGLTWHTYEGVAGWWL